MSGPKHLWSGDWESESRQPAAAPVVASEAESAAPPQAAARSLQPPGRAKQRRLFTREFGIALAAGVLAAVVTVALALTLAGGQTQKPHHRAGAASVAPGPRGRPQRSGGGGLNKPAQPTQSCQQAQNGCGQTTAVHAVTGPSADWLGMQIVTSSGGVVIDTIQRGSTADLGGLEPGDQIQSVDGHILGSASELHADTEGVKIGHPVMIKVMRASTQLTSIVPMTQRPTIHP